VPLALGPPEEVVERSPVVRLGYPTIHTKLPEPLMPMSIAGGVRRRFDKRWPSGERFVAKSIQNSSSVSAATEERSDQWFRSAAWCSMM
jgi:hypothetical protein